MVFKSRRHIWLTAKHKYKPYHSMCACLGWCVHFIEKKKELMEDNPSNQETEQNGDNLPKKNTQHATAIVFVYVAYNLKGKIFHCMCIHLYCLTVKQLNAFAKAETHASTNSYSIIILHIVGFQQDARHSLSLCCYHSHPFHSFSIFIWLHFNILIFIWISIRLHTPYCTV